MQCIEKVRDQDASPKKRNVVIICRLRPRSLDIKKTSMNGFLLWGSYIKHKYLLKNLTEDSSVANISARIHHNIRLPEWIGWHRFGIFELLNFINNGNKYVYNPSSDKKYFDILSLFPSITSLYLYNYLLNSDYNPVHIDNLIGTPERFKRALKDDPLAIVLSATFFQTAPEIKWIVRFIRKHNKKVPIVIGSILLMSKLDANKRLPEEYEDILDENVYMILDHGLTYLEPVLKVIELGGRIDGLSNMVFKDNGSIHYSEIIDTCSDYNKEHPDWTRLHNIPQEIAFVRASHGCSSKCKFCTFPKTAGKFRQRTIESIRDELRSIKAAGFQYLTFTDDYFAANKAGVKQICKMMIDEKFNFTWLAQIRTNLIDDETTKLFKEAGCAVLGMGIESGDDVVLRAMNKGTTASKNMKCLEILERNDILSYGSFIMGFPGETKQSINNTINWINSSPLRSYKIFVFHLLRGSIIWDEQHEHDISFYGDRKEPFLWKGKEMNALLASELLADFILSIDKAVLLYHYSPMYVFFQFMLKGYKIEDSIDFLKFHTDLIKNELVTKQWYERRKYRKNKLLEIKKLIELKKN